MNNQSQLSAQILQLTYMIKSMSVVTLSCLDEHDAFFNKAISHWKVDESGALWLVTDSLEPMAAYLQNMNLRFADTRATKHISLSGRAELCTEDFSSAYWLQTIEPGEINVLNFTAQANKQALIKFTPQLAVYWSTQANLMARLLRLFTSVLYSKFSSAKNSAHYVDFTSAVALDVLKQAS